MPTKIELLVALEAAHVTMNVAFAVAHGKWTAEVDAAFNTMSDLEASVLKAGATPEELWVVVNRNMRTLELSN